MVQCRECCLSHQSLSRTLREVFRGRSFRCQDTSCLVMIAKARNVSTVFMFADCIAIQPSLSPLRCLCQKHAKYRSLQFQRFRKRVVFVWSASTTLSVRTRYKPGFHGRLHWSHGRTTQLNHLPFPTSGIPSDTSEKLLETSKEESD